MQMSLTQRPTLRSKSSKLNHTNKKGKTPMNTPTFQKAQKVIKKARIGLSGVAGSGKTLTALKLAQGLGKRIALIDTENNSSVLYGDRLDFDVLNLEPPFEIPKYIDAIHQAEAAGYEVLILDSISHAWAGEGGILDTQGKMADGGMNSFTAWRKLTPQHNAFVEAMLRSKLHLIATMRAKMDYVVETNDKGKSVPKKVGLAPIQREGMDYEFDIVLDLDLNHNAMSTKDRSSLFDGRIVTRPDEKVGQQILGWLNHTANLPEQVQRAASVQNTVVGKGGTTLAKPSPAPGQISRPNPPLFDNSGAITGEKETAAMMGAISHATTTERLLAIDKSRRLGFDTNRLTKDQARRIREAIDERQLELSRVAGTKAA
jgi:AAA domain